MGTTGNEFRPIVLPKSMVDHILMRAHDHGGHNGFPRTYEAIKLLYCWVGMKRDTQQHCKRCQLCAKHNIAKVKLKRELVNPCISMDLTGEFQPHLDKDIGMLLQSFVCTHSYVIYSLLKIKKAEEVLHVPCLQHVQWKWENSIWQWNWVQEQVVWRSHQTTSCGVQGLKSSLQVPVQWKVRQFSQIYIP